MRLGAIVVVDTSPSVPEYSREPSLEGHDRLRRCETPLAFVEIFGRPLLDNFDRAVRDGGCGSRNVSHLQRMYRHFYIRLCDVVDLARLIDQDVIDYDYLRSLAEVTGCGTEWRPT